MKPFDAKLDAALALVEMAQLAKHDAAIYEPNIVGYKVYYGKHNPPISQRIGGCKSAEDAIRLMTLDAEARWGNLMPETYRDAFKVGSFDELVSTFKAEPIYDETSYFNAADQKAIRNPVTWRRISELLSSGPGNYTWNFLVVDRRILNNSGVWDEKEEGEYGEEIMLKKGEGVENYIKRVHSDIDFPNTITFVKMGSTGDPLDANMIVHTAAHAVMGFGKNGRASSTLRSMIDDFAYDIKRLYLQGKNDAFDQEKLQRFKGAARHFEIPNRFLSSQFCHFKAAHNMLAMYDRTLNDKQRAFADKRSAQNDEEMVHEMMAVFIKRDRVRFSPNEYCTVIDPQIIAKAAALEDKINKILRICLDRCVGQIIFDA